VGEEEAELGTLPPDLLLRTFLYQMRALANSGFRAVIAVSGHAGGNQHDLRRVATAFAAHVPLAIEVFADPELVAGKFQGDHAGKFELSQLLAIRPELVDLGRLDRRRVAGAGGRLALGDDAAEATAEQGRSILEAQLTALGEVVRNRIMPRLTTPPAPRVSLRGTERIWVEIIRQPAPFVTARPGDSQTPVSTASRWKPGEQFGSGDGAG